MDRARWEQIQELFHAALQLPAGSRETFIADRCGGDDQLRQQLNSLLNQETASLFEDGNCQNREQIEKLSRTISQPSTGESVTQPILLSGAVVGPYVIDGPLGKGGMGEVFRGRDSRLGRPVALKFLSQAMTADESVVKRFRREAQAISTLNHPNVCTVYDIGDHTGRPYIVMELLEGQTLKERIAAGEFTNDELLEIALRCVSHSANCRGVSRTPTRQNLLR